MNSSELGTLLHLASPTLPIGGFSYSQGLEAAVSHGFVTNADEAYHWIDEHLFSVIMQSEAIIWLYLHESWLLLDEEKITYWNNWFWASRETSEFRQETEQMGWSLLKLIKEHAWGSDQEKHFLNTIQPITLPCAHTFICSSQKVQAINGLHIYLYSWLENQVMAAIKSIPLGQVAGQKIIVAIGKKLSLHLDVVIKQSKSETFVLNTFAHQLNILSSRHEHQYSRLFRS